MAINRVCGLILPGSAKYLYDDVLIQHRVPLLLPIVLTVVGATLVQGFTTFVLTQLLSKSSQTMISDLRSKVQAHMGRLPISFYDANKIGFYLFSLRTVACLDWAFNSPFYWNVIDKNERSKRGFLNSDFCTIDEREFFIRGVIAIPIIDSTELFMWGVWAQLSQAHFDRMVELWNDPKIIYEPPYSGLLSNKISIYPSTLDLKLQSRSTDVKDRPLFEIEQVTHPLAVEQRVGITQNRIEEIATQMAHSGEPEA
jgi:hypothetical protein